MIGGEEIETVKKTSREKQYEIVCKRLMELLADPDVRVETSSGLRVLGVADKKTGCLIVTVDGKPGCWTKQNAGTGGPYGLITYGIRIFRRSEDDIKTIEDLLEKGG